MKKYFSIILMFVLSFLFAGCSDELEKENTVKKEIKNYFPNTKFVKIIDENDSLKKYKFKNDDFEFVVENRLVKDSTFYFDHSKFSTTYFLELYDFLEEDILDLCEDYDISFYDSYSEYNKNEYKDIQNFDKTTFLLDLYEGPEYVFYIKFEKDINDVMCFMEDFENLIDEYYPQKDIKLLDFNKEIAIYTIKDMAIKEKQKSLYYDKVPIINNWTYNYVEMNKVAKYNYVYYVKNEEIKNIETTFDKYKPKFINKLYINDEIYISDRYETTFVYNPIDDKYYTIICFGCKFDYNGGVDDYLQREIIEEYYENNNYIIDDKLSTTTYEINNNKYKVERERDRYKESLTFKKNGKLLDIKYYSEICEVNSRATYNYYISIDDFARLMEMDIEKVDLNEGIVFLNTK